MSKSKPSSPRRRSPSRKRGSETDLSGFNDERARKILRERARRLATPVENQAPEKLSMSIVTLRIGNESLAIETRFVLSALPAPPVVNLPGSGAHVEGLSLVRGQLLPIFDLLELLELVSDRAEVRPLLAIVGVDQPEFGVSVDEVVPSRAIAVDEVRELNAGDAEAPRFVRGITTEGITVLDGQSLLNHPALFL